MEKETETRGIPVSSGDPCRQGSIYGERGIALVVALVMLALLGILGSMALYTSTTELRITGNNRITQEAFFCADAAIEYAYTDPAIYMAIVPGPKPNPNISWPTADGIFNTVNLNGSNVTCPAQVRVEWEACGQPPVGSGGSAEAAIGVVKPNKNNYYIVNVIGTLPLPLPQTQIAIESREGRLALACPGE